jgi:two-component system, cell cycle response regulator DivK
VSRLATLHKTMRFENPRNTGSLGNIRRPSNTVAPFAPYTPNRFGVEHTWTPAVFAQRGPNVLVVEDNDETSFLLRTVLTRKGYRVIEAWDGKQAIEVAEGEEFDLILLDLQLPRLNGLGVIHRLRQNAKLDSVPIVIITGQDPEKYRNSAIAEGCDDFLSKPIDFDRLDALLDYYAPTGKLAA